MLISETQRIVVRVATLAIALFAGFIPLAMPTPRKLPGVALGSPGLLYAERGLSILVVLMFLLVLLIRAGWQGELPSKLSREGWEWTEAVANKADEVAALVDRQVRSLNEDISYLQRAVEQIAEAIGD